MTIYTFAMIAQVLKRDLQKEKSNLIEFWTRNKPNSDLNNSKSCMKIAQQVQQFGAS